MIDALLQWRTDPALLKAALLVSLVVFVAMLALVPFIVIRLPADYFARPQRHTMGWPQHHPLLRYPLLLARNLLGAVLVVAGLLMLVLPGQGVLTILIGLMLLNFPGKYRLERWLVGRPIVFATCNRIRRAAGRAPLLVPRERSGTTAD